MATDSDSPKPAPEARAASPELRLLDRRAFVGFPPLPVVPGLTITDFALQIPDVSFPFNVSAGASRYQRKKLLFGFLELSIDADLVTRKVAELAGKLAGLEELKLHFRPGYLEGQARLSTPERTPLTFKVAFDADGERLVVYLYDVRLYGFSPTPSVQVPCLVSGAVGALGLVPEVEVRGASGFSTRVLPALCQLAAVSRGFKMPALDTARLSAAEVSSTGVRLRFTSGGLPPPAAPDEELLLTLEGARAFADAEALVAQGKLAEAREAYLQAGDAQDAHPFAAERLLALLVADPQAHDLALDVAATLLRRREKSPAALWGEAVVRERRGEGARAAERYLALCALSRRASEDAAAFFAAEAAARSSRDSAPQVTVKALHEVLGLKPDHLPSLKALARASDQAKDRAGAVRAYRRLAALARDPLEAADAHVHLARLCAQTEDDIAGARLHCEAALRLSPDQPDALLLLGELCHRSGEHLRALKALDRLREVAMARHELDRVGQANLLAGRVWEEGLKQPENALLRFREAVSLLPGEPEPLFASARVAESLGKLQEALSGYQQALELAGPAPRSESVRQAAHASHHAMARLCRTRLGDPARAREHLESALSLDPRDVVALDELIPYFRATGRALELAEALEKAAAVHEEPKKRAALWAEAGELYRGRLQQPEKAERLLHSALEADADCRPALESMLALAEARRDGGLLTRCLAALARLTPEPKERAQKYRRLSVAARDLAFDLDLAVHALQEVLKAEPDDLPALGELCALQRKRSDMAGLAVALEERARVAEVQGDKRLAAAALRELANVLEARLGRVGEALVSLEKAARLTPDSAVLLDLADLSLRCERPEHARRALETLLATLPRTTAPDRLADVRARLGRACELLGDREAAIAAYAQAFPLRRLDDTLAGRLEALYSEVGETRELAELWATRAQALVAAERAEEAAPLFLKSARVLLERGEKSGALLRLNAALDAQPQGLLAAEVLDTLAELELERGEKLEAAKLYARKAGLVSEPRTGAKLLYRASLLAAGSSREEAFLAEALERDASFAPARLRRGELRLPTDPRGALEDFEAALNLPAADPDAPREEERLAMTRRAASAAVRANRTDAARRLLAQYVTYAPSDLDSQQELASLHRKAGAREQLADLLVDLWPRLTGEARRNARRELAELSLALGRALAAAESLRSLLAEESHDLWAAQALLGLLPPPGTGTPAEEAERLALLGTLIGAAEGEARAELLSRRAALHRAAGRTELARDDFAEAARLSRKPAALLLSLAELAREMGDDVGELSAWRRAVAADASLGERARERLLVLAAALVEKDERTPAREALQAAVALELSASERCDAFLALATLARRDGQWKAEAEALAEAARQGPTSRRVEALLARAALLEKRGALEEAGRSLEAALSLAPRHPQAIAARQRVLRGLEDWAGLAELLASEAPHAAPAEAAALYSELADLYLEKLEEPGPAEAALRQALRLSPTDGSVHRRLVGLVAARGDLLEAATLLEAAAETTSKPSEAVVLLREGAAYARGAKDLDRALKLARRAHGLVPAKGAELADLAELLYLRGDVKEALPLQESLAKAADFTAAPEQAEAVYLRLGELAERAGDARRAVSAYRRLLSERPLCEVAVQRLAALLEKDEPRAAFDVLVAHARALPPCEDTSRRLVVLSERARASLADINVAAALLARAAEMAEAPLPLHRQLAGLYRDAGRTLELMAELRVVALLALDAGDVDLAIASYVEEARLAEDTGRLDEALRSLGALRDLLASKGKPAAAAAYERRRAELLRDAKLDLAEAEASLERAFSLSKDLWTAQMGASLAERRADAAAEARWLERALPLQPDVKEQGALLLRLARLHLEGLADAAKAESFLRDALHRDRFLKDAETLLAELLERDGRLAELAGWYEECALEESEAPRRSLLLQRAAAIYRDRAGRPDAAAAALIAARAASPDDLELTAQAAELLHEVGRAADAADFDAILLEADPFREPVFTRHRAWLVETEDRQALAGLMLHRAEHQKPSEAAESYMAAARAFREVGALERALLCEDQAFGLAPDNAEAFARLRERFAGDVRRLAELLAQRAAAVPAREALPLLRERAEKLLEAGESLLAAEAFDVYLAQAGDDVDALSARAELAAEGGGPSAAQPYDRRLLAAGGESLPVPVRVRTHLRLGHASLAAGAFRDAADAFESVVTLDPEGERGQEALSLLSEVYAKTGNGPGLYRTSLQLARKADNTTAEVLYRRAADLFDNPKESIDALLPLTKLRPADATVIDRAVEGLRALARHGDLLEVYEAGANAAGGTRAAELLLAAASVAETQLADADRAWALKERAAESDPENREALRALVEGLRQKGDKARLLEALERLVPRTDDADEASVLRLELAGLAKDAGREALAREALEAVVVRGAAGAGYADALEALEGLLEDAPSRRAEVLMARAELVSGEARATFCIEAAKAFQSAGRLPEALKAAKAAASAQANLPSLMLVANLHRASGDSARAAQALLQAARIAYSEERPPLLLEAADLWEKAGETAEALEVIERIASEAPDTLTPAELAERFGRFGRFQRACEVGFAPAMAAGDYTDALALAMQAGDKVLTRKALWALAEMPDAELLHVVELADDLRTEGDFEGLLRLADLTFGQDVDLSRAMRDEVLRRSEAPLPARLRALEGLGTSPDLATRLNTMLPGLDALPVELAEQLLVHARALPAAQRIEALGRAADGWPSRSRALLRERYELERAEGQDEPAARTLARLIDTEEDSGNRAALLLERGELLLTVLDRPEEARGCLERAVDDDPALLAAVRYLLGLYDETQDAADFAAIAEHLETLAGAEALEPYRERLADAYEALGRLADAATQLEALEETPERLARRARLAEERGLVGEALQLRERLSDEPAMLESILRGYLEVQLVALAARLAERLLDAGVLSPEATRLVAERLAPTPEGAALAVRIWPELLRENLTEVDGWTLYAEALRQLGRTELATRMDGFGAALSSSDASVALPTVSSVPVPTGFSHPLPEGALPVTSEQLPRLYAALKPVLKELGAGGVRVKLDPTGGVEAWLAGPDELVLGAGGLACFGQVELAYLCALALCLGEAGKALTRPGPVFGFEPAAVRAFRAVPSSLAAGRVLARLDTEVRGGDPATVDVGVVLSGSATFRALALAALDDVAASATVH